MSKKFGILVLALAANIGMASAMADEAALGENSKVATTSRECEKSATTSAPKQVRRNAQGQEIDENGNVISGR